MRVLSFFWPLAACLALAPLSSAEARLPGDLPAGVPSPEDAPIAVLVDITSGQVLFARNADRRFVPASITKVMTTFVAFEKIADGKLDANQTVRVSADVSEEWFGKGSSMLLPPDAEVLVADLIAGISTVSANDGSIVLAQSVSGSVPGWLAEMNSTAREIGMVNSHFGTPNGWPDDGHTFTTADDLVLLAKTMIERHPSLYADYIGRANFSYNGLSQVNRDPLLGRIAGSDGIKTGFTSESGFGFLGSASRDGQRLVMVLAGVNRNALRAKLSRQFMAWGFEGFERKRVLRKGMVLGSARVQGGSALSIAVQTKGDVFVNIPGDHSDGVRYTIAYDGPLRAPIRAGESIARLEITAPGMQPAVVPLVATGDVEEAGFLRTIYNGFAGWLG